MSISINDSGPFLSIVSPVYGAKFIVDELVKRIVTTLELNNLTFEIILVDDGSPDNSWEKIQKNCSFDKRIKGIKLSRNFGQHYAITAGLDSAIGEWVVVMDCDLQDQPEEIINLLKKAQEGYDIVFARRIERQDHFFKRFFSYFFYKLLSYLTGTIHDSSVANFGIYHKKVIEAVCRMRESIRYFPTMVNWVGFKHTKIKVEHSKRLEGETSYNLKKLINLSLDVILAFSDKPIRIIIKIGTVISLFAFLFAFVSVIRFFFW